LHLTLVDGEPALPRTAVPDLVDERGRFERIWRLSGAAMFFPAHVRGQMRVEIRAQFEAFRAKGLKLDHVTGHKHFHLHPTILSALLGLAKEFGVSAVRAPFEPSTILARIDGARPRFSASALAQLARLQRARLWWGRISAPDQVIGVAWSGSMTLLRLARTLSELRPAIAAQRSWLR
jgi:chitin disaccharide deacetylase